MLANCREPTNIETLTNGEPHYCLLLKETLAEADAEDICFEQRPKG